MKTAPFNLTICSVSCKQDVYKRQLSSYLALSNCSKFNWRTNGKLLLLLLLLLWILPQLSHRNLIFSYSTNTVTSLVHSKDQGVTESLKISDKTLLQKPLLYYCKREVLACTHTYKVDEYNKEMCIRDRLWGMYIENFNCCTQVIYLTLSLDTVLIIFILYILEFTFAWSQLISYAAKTLPSIIN